TRQEIFGGPVPVEDVGHSNGRLHRNLYTVREPPLKLFDLRFARASLLQHGDSDLHRHSPASRAQRANASARPASYASRADSTAALYACCAGTTAASHACRADPTAALYACCADSTATSYARHAGPSAVLYA